MSSTDPDLLQSLWDEALQAFMEDPSYVIEMAKVGSQQAPTRAKSAILESSGV